MNAGVFRQRNLSDRPFPAQNPPDNGERAHCLLCGRETLAKPPGAAAIAKGGFNKESSARRDERDPEGAPLRRGDVYIANVPLRLLRLSHERHKDVI